MNEEERGFRLSNVFYYILRGRRLIAIFALIGLVFGVILSGIGFLRGEISKEYQITSSIAIIAKTQGGNYAFSKNNNPDSEDVYLAQEITDSAIYILRSDRLLQTAIDEAGLVGVGVRDIQTNLSLSQYNETQIIELTLYWRSASEGVRILDAINGVSGKILLETLNIGNVSVVNPPASRYIVGGKVSTSTWVICALIGVAIAIGLCILKLFVFPVITNVKDIEPLYSMKLLGSVPYDGGIADSVPLVEEGNKLKKSIVSISHVLSNHMEDMGLKRLMITSSVHDEGRTTITANIAREIASSGVKTLLVDCDFKNPILSSVFGGQIPYENTLNAVYYGDADETDAVHHIGACLDLLPVILSDKSISLNDVMLSMIEKIAAGYDFVIYDCAPVGVDAEVLKMRKVADTALFVVKYDYTETAEIEAATKLMAESKISIIGCVVTSVKTFKDILLEAQKISVFIKKPRKQSKESNDKTTKKEQKKKEKKDKKKDKAVKKKDKSEN